VAACLRFQRSSQDPNFQSGQRSKCEGSLHWTFVRKSQAAVAAVELVKGLQYYHDSVFGIQEAAPQYFHDFPFVQMETSAREVEAANYHDLSLVHPFRWGLAKKTHRAKQLPQPADIPVLGCGLELIRLFSLLSSLR
jgi:hypothetical protein